MNPDAALAETTRRAQQSLTTLVDGLAAAPRSLRESLAAPRQPVSATTTGVRA